MGCIDTDVNGACVFDGEVDWAQAGHIDYLLTIIFHYQASIENTGCVPSEMKFGAEISCSLSAIQVLVKTSGVT